MDYRVQRLIAFIHQHPNQKLPLEKMSHLVKLSVPRVQHLFKSEIGLSVRAYQRKLQIEKARELLTQDDLSIKEICAAVGFCNPSRFIKVFKQTFGMTPAQYRKALLQARYANSKTESVEADKSKQAGRQTNKQADMLSEKTGLTDR